MPNASLTILNSSSPARTTAIRRCGPGATLNGVSGGGVERGPRDLADAGGDLARAVERLARAGETRAERAGGDLGGGAHRAGQPARGELGARRLGLRDPGLGAVDGARPPARGRTARSRGRRRRRRRRPRGGSSRSAPSPRQGRARPATAPTAAWSGRAAARTRARSACSSASSPPGSRQRGVAHVVGEVERRVVDPQRPAGLERRRRRASGGSAGRGAAATRCGRGTPRARAARPRTARARRCACACSASPGRGSPRRPPTAGRDAAGWPSSNSFRAMTDSTTSRAALVTGCSSGIGRATAERLAATRLDRLRDRPQARDAARSRGPRLPHAGARRHRRGVDARGGRGRRGRARRGRRARQQRRLQPVGRDRDRAAREGARAVRDQRVRARAPVPARAARDARAALRARSSTSRSMGGKLVFPGGGFYHATKYAVEAISDALRFEVKGFGIDVILIEPGLIRTAFGETASGGVVGGGRRRGRLRAVQRARRARDRERLREGQRGRPPRRPAGGGRQGDREGAGAPSARAPATRSRRRRSC